MPSIRQRFHLSPCSDFRSHFYIQQLQVLFDAIHMLSGYGQLVMGIDWNPIIPPQNLFSLETLVKRRYQKGPGLCPETLRGLLWLDDEYLIEIPWVNPLFEVGLLLPD